MLAAVIHAPHDIRVERVGDTVVAPFVWSDGSCGFCAEGRYTSCVDGGFWGRPGTDGRQGEAVRGPHADGTLIALPSGLDDQALVRVLTLSDVMCTGPHVGDGGPHGGSAGVDLRQMFDRNVSPRGGVAPARAYIPAPLDEVLGGTLDPSPVAGRTVGLGDVPDGYAAMNARTARKVLVLP